MHKIPRYFPILNKLLPVLHYELIRLFLLLYYYIHIYQFLTLRYITFNSKLSPLLITGCLGSNHFISSYYKYISIKIIHRWMCYHVVIGYPKLIYRAALRPPAPTHSDRDVVTVTPYSRGSLHYIISSVT